MDYIPIPKAQIKDLPRRSYIQYTLKGEPNKFKRGFLKGHWKKEINGVKVGGLIMSFRKSFAGESWTVRYDQIKLVEKKIAPEFYFEFQFLINNTNT